MQNTINQVDYRPDSQIAPKPTYGPYNVAVQWSTRHPNFPITTTQAPRTTELFKPLRSAIRRRNDVVNIPASNNDQSKILLDLGVSSSQDSRRSQPESNFDNSVKIEQPDPPSRHYTPPYVNPRYDLNYTNPDITTDSSHTTSSTTPLSSVQFISSTSDPTTTTTTSAKISVAAKSTQGVIIPASKKSTTKDYEHSKQNNRGATKFNHNVKDRTKSASEESRILTRPTQGFSEDSTAFPPNNNNIHPPAQTFVPIVGLSHGIQKPATDLIPPYESFHYYDDATTQGPPIYFEWKIPASGLEPPKYESRSNEYFDNEISTTESASSISIPTESLQLPVESNASVIFRTPSNGLEPPVEQDIFSRFAHNPFLTSALASLSSTEKLKNKSPTPRSISASEEKIQNTVEGTTYSKESKDNNYLDLKKLLLIPDYTFPLEVDGRPGYQQANSVNSFQIKIPEKTGDKPWYGENAQCPECHPSFLKPGTCEPCIKIRR